MTARHRLRLDDNLEVFAIDPFARDTEYIYDEIFTSHIYGHPGFKLGERPTIVDVGANIGLSAIWFARQHRPRTVLAYEASPTTFTYLADNVAEHVDPAVTRVDCFNLAVSREADRILELHQPLFVSGLSTLVDGTAAPWIDELRAKGGLATHSVLTTTLSREIATHGLETVDLLKIDVEGHFMEVLDGIAPPDIAKVRNIVLEIEYAEALGHSGDSVCAMLRGYGYRVAMDDEVVIYAWRE